MFYSLKCNALTKLVPWCISDDHTDYDRRVSVRWHDTATLGAKQHPGICCISKRKLYNEEYRPDG